VSDALALLALLLPGILLTALFAWLVRRGGFSPYWYVAAAIPLLLNIGFVQLLFMVAGHTN
jgi:hypothetical protein